LIYSSIEFVVFFAALLAGLAVLGNENQRRNLLLAASYVFYGWWDWRFCFLLLGITTIDYFVSRQIESRTEKRARRRWLLVSLCMNLGVLGFFKYTNFFADNLREPLLRIGVTLPEHVDILLPVGISFITFQTMSYSIDVYRGILHPPRRFRDFALFAAFFPQLVAGPIVRGSFFLPQLANIHPLKRENLVRGSELFLRGFVKKVVFADTLAFMVDPVFSNPALFSAPTCWLAALAYTAQIYFDFSGYTDMAIGVARALGFELPENFRHPYLSRNLGEFWRRWHISLSTWLRDYLYIPLGGNRRGPVRTYVNLLITMLLGGLWHGASWTFIAWGALHGLGLVVHRLFESVRGDARPTVPGQILAWLVTFLFVVVCWVFFRAPDFERAWILLGKMAWVDPAGVDWFYVQAIVILAIAAIAHIGVLLRGERPWILPLDRPAGWATALTVMILVLYFSPVGANPFIYFQF
jgi:alginate O-acetyltransferase complex protein AlgI